MKRRPFVPPGDALLAIEALVPLSPLVRDRLQRELGARGNCAALYDLVQHQLRRALEADPERWRAIVQGGQLLGAEALAELRGETPQPEAQEHAPAVEPEPEPEPLEDEMLARLLPPHERAPK